MVERVQVLRAVAGHAGWEVAVGYEIAERGCHRGAIERRVDGSAHAWVGGNAVPGVECEHVGCE
jgi:hypothetical protein